MSATIDREEIRRLEWHEMICWPTWYAAASRQLEVDLELRLLDYHGAQVALSPKLDHILFNRVLGFGNEQPATEEHLDQIIALYRRAGVEHFFFQISPAAQPEELADWLRARGFTAAEPWAKLRRGVEKIPDAPTFAHIEEVPPADIDAAVSFGSIVQEAFEYPPRTVEWFTALVGRPGWRQYLAYDGGKRVGAAALFVSGDWASLEIGVVLPHARNRGIHSALIARRIRDAAEAGCRLLTMETSAESEGNRAQSFRNARRLGFNLAYFRPNWEFRAKA